MDGLNDSFDRLPPHSLDAEMCVLASMMLDVEMLEQITGVLNRDSFYSADHMMIFDVLVDLFRAGTRVDAIILREALSKRGLLEEIGGTAYIAQILGTVPSAAHGLHYADIVRDKALLRSLIAISNESLREAYAPRTGEVAPIFDSAIAKLELAKRTASTIHYKRFKDVLFEFYESKVDNKASNFIRSGLTKLDDIIYGFPIPGTSIIAGRGGMSKSLLVKQFARHIATAGTPSMLCAIEEQENKIAANAISAAIGVDSRYVFDRKWDEEDQKRAAEAYGLIGDIPFFVTDKATRLSEVCSAISHGVRKDGVKIAFVDHIHILQSDDSREQQEQRISGIGVTLKMLAKRLGIHICMCAQMNLGGGGQENYKRRPLASDLRGSGSLFDNTDLLIMLHRSDFYHQNEPGYRKNHTLEVYVHKQKYGGPGSTKFFFDGPHSTVKEFDMECFVDDPDIEGQQMICEPTRWEDLAKV